MLLLAVASRFFRYCDLDWKKLRTCKSASHIVAIVNLQLWSRINTFQFTFVYMATCDVTAERRKDVMTSSVIRWRHYVCRRHINKAQGQTFRRVGIYLPSPVFSHGQLYVAFSRARSFDTVYVKVDTCTNRGTSSQGVVYTKNVVYKDIFLGLIR